MGKERFLPIQMRLAKVLFQSLAIATVLMLGTTFVHGHEQLWLHVATAGLAMVGAAVNAFVVVPRALRAGGRALRDARKEADDSRSVADFVSVGGGEASRVWHRLVVVFVVVMVAGLFSHGSVLLPGTSVLETLSAHSLTCCMAF